MLNIVSLVFRLLVEFAIFCGIEPDGEPVKSILIETMEKFLPQNVFCWRKDYLVDHAKPNFSKPQRDDSGCLS